MSLSLQQLVDLAVQQAGGGTPADRLEVTAEALLPVALDNVQRRYASRPETRTLLKKTKDLTLAGGTAALPPDVLTEWITEAHLYDPADQTKDYAYVPEWRDFTSGLLDHRLGYFALQNATTLAQVEAEADYVAGSGFAGAMKLDAACALAVPASDTATFDCAPEVEAEILRELAALLVQSQAPPSPPLFGAVGG